MAKLAWLHFLYSSYLGLLLSQQFDTVPVCRGTAVTFLSDRDDFQARQIKSVMLRNKQEIPRELQAREVQWTLMKVGDG